MEVKFSLKVFVLIQTPYSSKQVTLVCSPFVAKFSSSILVFRSDNLDITKSILVPRSSMTISQSPDVLAEEHDSLNLFSTGEDSAELFVEIVFLGHSYLLCKMINVQIRRQVNRGSRPSRPWLNNSQCKFKLTRHLYSILILGDAEYFFHCAFHNLTNFSISPAVNYRI